MAEMSGQEIYDNFRNGVGAEGLATGAAMVRKIAARYRDRAIEIHQLVGEMESAWEGTAADRGLRGAGPLLTEHETASHHFSVSEDLTDRQSGSFFRARNSVVPVPPAPGDVPAWGPLAPDWVPYERRVQEHNAAARHNVDVMNSYSGASAYNADNLPSSYGELADDQAGAVVDKPDTITVGDPDNGPHGSEPRDSGSRDSGPLARTDSDAAGPGAGPNINPSHPPFGQQDPDSTTPGGYSPVPSPGTSLPTTDFGAGRPALTGSGPLSGTNVLGVGYGPGGVRGGPGEFGGPRGGGPAGGLVPRGGSGAEPQVARSVSASVTRNVGAGMGAVPVGAGRGRDEEDAERKAPAYLEGGDPEDLFGSELLTAPPVIGEDDED